METESHDLLKAFCETYSSQNSQKWPTTEYDLAEAFVTHFGIRLVAGVSDLQNFLLRTNIELFESDRTGNALGLNMSVDGKRGILISTKRDDVQHQVHTVLHEIRELIEADFHRLGFATMNSPDLDSRSDEFSFAVHIYTEMVLIRDCVKYVKEPNSMWGKLAGLSILGLVIFLFSSASFIGAFGYRFESPSVLEGCRLNNI